MDQSPTPSNSTTTSPFVDINVHTDSASVTSGRTWTSGAHGQEPMPVIPTVDGISNCSSTFQSNHSNRTSHEQDTDGAFLRDLLAGQVPEDGLQPAPEEPRPYMTSQELEDKFVDLYLRHPSTSKAAAADFLRLCKEYGESVHPLIRSTEAEAIFRRDLSSFRTLERSLLKQLPVVQMDLDFIDMGATDREIERFDFRNMNNYPVIEVRGVTEYPRGKYGSYRYLEVRSEYYVRLSSLLNFIRDKHGLAKDTKLHIMFGADGVREANSNKIVLEVVYISALKCPKHALPIRIGRSSFRNDQVDVNAMVEKVVMEVRELGNEVEVHSFLCDKPGRGKVTHLLGASGYMNCEYCFIRGVMHEYDGPLVRGSKPTKMTFPFSDDIQQKTHELVRDAMETAARIKTEHMGYKGRSCLLDLPGFDIVTSVVAEYLHGACLGLQKRLMQQCFDLKCDAVKKNLLRYKKRINPLIFIREARSIKAPSDFNRSCNRMEPTGLKGEEYRNFMICSSFAIITTMSHRKPLVYIQLLFTFLMRAYLMPDAEFEAVKEAFNLKDMRRHFQEQYQDIFPQYYWVYYSHMFYHMEDIRKAGPLTLTSMFPPEGMFHWMLGGICPGTSSIPKQGMERVYARYQSTKHRCWKFITFKPYVQGQRVNDSIGYIWDPNTNTRQLWRVIESNVLTETCVARQYDTNPYVLDCPKSPHRRLDLGKVGVYVNKGLTDRIARFSFQDFDGKGVIVNNVIVTLPRHILQESN